MDIKGYENYTIDLDGNVWSKKKKRFLKPGFSTNGYLQVTIYKNGKKNTSKVHKLMGRTYLPNLFNKTDIDHKNRIRTDNRLINLKWATKSENSQNRSLMSNNKTGYSNIFFDNNRGRFRLTIIRNSKVEVKRYFSYSKWNLEQVVKIRDDYYKELDYSNDFPFAFHISALNKTTP